MIGTVFDTILFVLVPELLTENYIVKKSCNYNQASRFIYGPVLHTTHHVFFGLPRIRTNYRLKKGHTLLKNELLKLSY